MMMKKKLSWKDKTLRKQRERKGKENWIGKGGKEGRQKIRKRKMVKRLKEIIKGGKKGKRREFGDRGK